MRKLSRLALSVFGKKKKRGKSSARYMTESQALEYLQVNSDQFWSLNSDQFRFLCIANCILPREPKKKFKGFTPYFPYYRVKDIDSLIPPKPKLKHPIATKERAFMHCQSYFWRKLTWGDPVNNKDPIQ